MEDRQERLKTPDDLLKLTHHLDTLLAIDYHRTNIEETTQLVCGVCDSVSLDDHLLLSKCLLLISKAFGRVEVGFVSSIQSLVDFTITAFQQDKAWLIDDSLFALRAVLCASNTISESHVEQLIGDRGILLSFLSEGELNSNQLKVAVQCVGYTCCPRESLVLREACVLSALRCLLRILQSPPLCVASDASQKCKLFSACLKALRNVVAANRALAVSNAATLLATLKVYAFFSPSNLANPVSFQPHLVSELFVPSSTAAVRSERKAHAACPPAARANKKRRSAKSRAKANESGRGGGYRGIVRRSAGDSCAMASSASSGKLSQQHSDREMAMLSSQLAALPLSQSVALTNQDSSTSQSTFSSLKTGTQHQWVVTSSSSESELSDSESAQKQRERNLFNQVQVNSMLCLQDVIHMLEKKVVFGYWSSFIPDSFPAHSSASHLLSLISDEGPSKVCIAALSLLMSILDGSKQFLIAADDSDQPHSAFIPFSITLGRMIISLHDCLISVVGRVSGSTLAPTLKCLSLLIANCPYNKLQQGYITRILDSIAPHTSSPDADIRMASFTCLGSMVSACLHLDEVETLLMTRRKLGNGKKQVLWIVSVCLEQITKSKKLPPDERGAVWYGGSAARIEALRVLGLLFANYPSCARTCWQLILDAVSCFLNDDVEDNTRVYCLKLLDKWAKFADSQLDDADGVESEFAKQVLSYWNDLLSGPMISLLDVSSSALYCVSAIDCVSSMGPRVFDRLPRDKHALVVTSVFRLSSVSDSGMKAAAVRAVGVFVTYPCVIPDVTFLLDSCDCVVCCMSEAALAVRIKAAWSLGNLTDCLLLRQSTLDDQVDLPSTRIISLFSCAIEGCGDNDKVRTNALRALGNLCRFITQDMLGSDLSLLDRGMQVLDQAVSSGAVKIRWNACYAAGNLFQNGSLLGGTKWSEKLLQSLFKAMRDSKNFKVRINAASAAHIAADHQLFPSDDLFYSYWEDLLTALEMSDSVDDFSEFKYRSSLHKQLLSLICSLTELCQDADLLRVNRIVSQRKEVVIHRFEEFLRHNQSASVQQEHRQEQGTRAAAETKELATRITVAIDRLGLDISASFHSESC